jgi:hypothetical protein
MKSRQYENHNRLCRKTDKIRLQVQPGDSDVPPTGGRNREQRLTPKPSSRFAALKFFEQISGER